MTRRIALQPAIFWLGFTVFAFLFMLPMAATLFVKGGDDEYIRVATNVPSTTWLPRSRRKFRNSRGPNCCEARVSATMVIEKATPATVIIDPAMVESTSRAPSGLPAQIQPTFLIHSELTCPSRWTETNDNPMLPALINAGTNQ
mgnify:CR=1 FL=1